MCTGEEKMLIRVVSVCVCLAVALSAVDGAAAAPAKNNPDERKWDSVYCNATALKLNVEKNNAKTKGEYQRALMQWNNMVAADKTFAENVVKDKKGFKTVDAAKFAKIPMACLLRLPLAQDGITLAQTLAVAELGNTQMLLDAVAKLAAADKPQVLTHVLDDAKPSTAKPYKDTLIDSVKRAIGKIFFGEVANKAAEDTVTCPYLIGALEGALDKAKFEKIIAQVKTKKCSLDMLEMNDVSTIAQKVLALYASVLKITTIGDDIVTKMEPFLPMMDQESCGMLFSDTRMADALKSIELIKGLDLTALDKIWKINKCQDSGKSSSPCLEYLAISLLDPKVALITDANWESLGHVAAFLPPATIMKILKAYSDSTPTPAEEKRCVKFKLFKLYEGRGHALATELKLLVAQCTKEEPISGITDWSKQTVATVTKFAGYIPFLDDDKLQGAKALPKAVLCDPPFFDGFFHNVLQYGKSDIIKTICDKHLDVSKPVPEQEQCEVAMPPHEKAELKRSTKTSVNTTTVKAITKVDADAVKLVTNANTLRTVEDMSTADACHIVGKSTIQNAETLYDALKSPYLSKCFDAETIASKSKTAGNNAKMGNGYLNKAQQIATLKALISTKPVEKWTATEIGDNIRAVPMEITPEIVKNMTAEPFIIAEKFAHPRVLSRIKTNALEAVLEKVTGFLATIDEADPLKELTVGQAMKMGGLIAYLKDPDSIKNAIKDVGKKYCSQMSDRMKAGGDPQCRKLPDLSKVLTLCKAANSVPATAKKWLGAEVATLNMVACPLAKADIIGMTDAEFKKALGTFSKCQHMPKATKEGFVEMAKKAGVFGSDTATWDAAAVAQLGPSLKYFSKGDLDKIKKAVFVNVDLRPDEGECIESKFGEDDDGYKTLLTSMKKVLASGTARRKKRATTVHAWTYDDLIPRPDSFIQQLTVDELKAIPPNELKPLHKRFGYMSDWTDDQAKTLVTQIKAAGVVGEPKFCDFTAVELIDSGYLVLRMTDEEIKCLDLSGDKATPLTSLGGWKQTQYKLLFEEYKKDKNLKIDASNAEALSYLGSLMCGMNDSDIVTVKADQLKKAMPMVADLYMNCNHSKLVSLLKVAQHKDAYKAIKEFTAANVAEVGVIIAGVNQTEIAELKTLIADVPVDILKKIDKETIKYMTKDAKDKLPKSVRADLGVDKPKDSGAGLPMFNGLLLLLTLMVTVRLL